MSAKYRPAYKDPLNSLVQDFAGKEVLVVSSGAPSNSVAGYQKGCLYLRTDGSAGTVLYVNQGTVTSTTWQAVA